MKLTQRFSDALLYAARLHADQVRKGSAQVPYVAHLMGVSSLALEFGADEDQAIAALLHDAVEDQGGYDQLEKIRLSYGESVAQIVSDCSDSFETPKPDWRARKEAYISHLAQISPASRLVSCADKIYNARAITRDYHLVGEKIWERFLGGRTGTLWYYRAIVNAFQACDKRPMVAELERVVIELEALTAIPGA